jgi:hypothetical protein
MNSAVVPIRQGLLGVLNSSGSQKLMFEPLKLTKLEWILFNLSIALLVITSPVSFWFCMKTVSPYNCELHCRFGRVVNVLEPGLNLYNPLTDYLVMIEPTKTHNAQTDKIILAFEGKLFLIAEAFLEYRMTRPGLALARLPESEDYVSKMALIETEKLLRSKDAISIVQNRTALEETVKTSVQMFLDPTGYEVNRVFLHVVAAVHPDSVESSNGPNMMYH